MHQNFQNFESLKLSKFLQLEEREVIESTGLQLSILFNSIDENCVVD
jgi:hypothetical protein